MSDRKLTAFRLPEDTMSKLDELCKAYDCNRTQYIVEQINLQYDKLHGSPEMLAMLEQLKEVSEKLKSFSKTK